MSGSWVSRVEAERRADNLTLHEREVLKHLHYYRGRGGVAFPSHKAVAAAAKIGVSTVKRALMKARDLGLITWTERRVRAGWRLVRATNVYSFLTPRGPVSPTTSTKVQPERGSRKRRFSGLFVAAREDRGPSSGSDDWARANAQRQIRILLAGAGKEDGS